MGKQSFILFFLAAFILRASVPQRPPGKTLLLFPFTQSGRQIDENRYSAQIPDMIQKALSSSNHIMCIDGGAARKSSASKLRPLSKEQAIEIGRQSGAELFIYGKHECLAGGQIDIIAELWNVQEDHLEERWIASRLDVNAIDTFTHRVAEDIGEWVARRIALERLVSLSNPNPSFRVRVRTDKETYFTGETIRIVLESNQNCYIHVFDVGTSGKIHLLFPNKTQPSPYCAKYMKIILDNIVVHPPSGTDIVKVIATLDPVTLPDLISGVPESNLNPPTFQEIKTELDELARGFELAVSPLAEDRWTTQTLILKIIEE